MTEIETTWDTDETSRIIANDEGLYNDAMRLSREAYDIGRLAFLMQREFTAYLYNNIALNNIDWNEIAAEYMEED